MTTPGKRAASYCRLSLAAMGDTTNVDDQDKINHRVADQRGWTIESQHVYKDNSKSAWKRDRKRPGWDAMLAAVERGEIDAIISYHGDRLVRQPRDLEDLLDLAHEKGITLISPTGQYDLDDPDHQMMLLWIAARAKNEVDHISRRTKEGHRRRKERGLVRAGGRGGRAFGFADDGLTHVEEECENLREGARRVLAGEDTGVIIRDWAGRGIVTPTGGPFSHGGFKKMIMRPRYAGLLPDGETPAAWEPIFDADRDKAREIWESVCAVLNKKAAAFDYATNARRYLLTNIAVCGSCEQPVAIRHNTRSESLRGYGCINPDCKKKVHRSVAHTDAYVIGRVLRLLSDRDVIGRLVVSDDSGLGAEINALMARKAEAEDQIANLATYPGLKLDVLAKGIASFDEEIAKKRARLELSARRRLILDHAGLDRDGWKALPLATRRSLVAAIFHVTILPSGRRGPGFDPETVRLEPVGDD